MRSMCIASGKCPYFDRLSTSFFLSRPAYQNCTVAKNDIISFTLHNRSRRDWYMYILNLGPDGKISAVYPAPGSQAEAALDNRWATVSITLEAK